MSVWKTFMESIICMYVLQCSGSKKAKGDKEQTKVKLNGFN